MNATINAKQLRASLPELVRRVRRGARFTVVYRSRPAFQIVPVSELDQQNTPLESDSLYRARAVGSSTESLTAADHDTILYGR